MEIIKRIKASNILSFGQDGLDLPLGKLNVLIGINGSGKSNFIELFSLLRSFPRSSEDSTLNLQKIISKGGGVNEWVWKGAENVVSSIETLIAAPTQGHKNIRHKFSFTPENLRLKVIDEVLENETPNNPKDQDVYFYYRFQNGNPVLNIKEGSQKRALRVENVEPDFSILSQRKDPQFYPEIAYVGGVYEKMRLYREWSFGRNTIFRESQKADLRNDRLEEDFSNLGLFLNKFGRTLKAKSELTKSLKLLYKELEGYEILIDAGSSTVQVNFNESRFDRPIPATRLSDGSLRYLCLLAILHDPTPPPFICIEEPELGLHSDMIPHIADLLIKASERTQLVITTHSDFLIDALSDHPETVLVVEKHDGQTTIERLKKEEIDVWLKNYSGLGEIWTSGEIGAKRW